MIIISSLFDIFVEIWTLKTLTRLALAALITAGIALYRYIRDQQNRARQIEPIEVYRDCTFNGGIIVNLDDSKEIHYDGCTFNGVKIVHSRSDSSDTDVDEKAYINETLE